MEFITLFLAAVGLIVVFFYLLDALWGIVQLITVLVAPLITAHNENSLQKKYGSWALITGCTDGIGKAYAFELARRGINIVLVSRTQEKLKITAMELENAFNVKTKIIQADFSTGDKAIQMIKEELGNLQIGILVNNVGKNYEYPMYLGEVPEKDVWDIVNINVGAVTMMCRLLIENMKSRGRGAIVNISSGAEEQPLPLFTVYSATKAYIKSFSAALRYEYSSFGLTVQHLMPLFVNTKMNDFSTRLRHSSTFVPDAGIYAKYAVETLGTLDESTGYWAHGIQHFFITLAPIWLRTFIGARLTKAFRRDYFDAKGITSLNIQSRN